MKLLCGTQKRLKPLAPKTLESEQCSEGQGYVWLDLFVGKWYERRRPFCRRGWPNFRAMRSRLIKVCHARKKYSVM
jgi:hypothetical protein